MPKKQIAAVVLLASFAMLSFGGQKADLPDRYRKWLDEEVVYIITARESGVFLQLQSDRERDIFIEAFWKQRDPTPGTPQNEFKEEHFRRLAYATKFYGRGTPLPGWRTDRGRMYIILGAPKSIEQFDNTNGVYPTEIWFYLGNPDLGLPTGFNLVFFKRAGLGDYTLYSPSNDGPKSLIADSMENFRDELSAYKALQKLAPNLASQTLSLIPGDPGSLGGGSLASERLIAEIVRSPQKRVEVGYADAILKFKDFVEVEYTANYIASDAGLQVIRDASGVFLVHYSIEPAKISVEARDGQYAALFQLTGRLSDSQGRTIYQFDKDFPFRLTAAELDDVRAKSISIQDAFPLVPGTYEFDILLKNVLSKEFTGADRPVVVPGSGDTVRMSPLLLAYGVESKPSPDGERIPFKTGGRQLLCQGRKTFSDKDTAILFFQVYGLTEELKDSGTLRFEYLREDKEFLVRKVRVAEAQAGMDFFEAQALATFPPGYYRARVTLLDRQGRELASAKEDFEISLAAEVPRPLIMSKVVPSVKAEDDLFVTGAQFLNAGDPEAARNRLADAYSRSMARPDIAFAYAQALFRSNDLPLAREVLVPVADGPEPSAGVLALLGLTCQALGRYAEAETRFAAYLSRFGANVEILNGLGTCHLKLGNRDEAVKAWTKSLELRPDQDKVRALLESLRKK